MNRRLTIPEPNINNEEYEDDEDDLEYSEEEEEIEDIEDKELNEKDLAKTEELLKDTFEHFNSLYRTKQKTPPPSPPPSPVKQISPPISSTIEKPEKPLPVVTSLYEEHRMEIDKIDQKPKIIEKEEKIITPTVSKLVKSDSPPAVMEKVIEKPKQSSPPLKVEEKKEEVLSKPKFTDIPPQTKPTPIQTHKDEEYDDEYEDEEYEDEEYSGDEEGDISDVDDSDLLKRLDEKYGKLPATSTKENKETVDDEEYEDEDEDVEEEEEEEEEDDHTWTSKLKIE